MFRFADQRNSRLASIRNAQAQQQYQQQMQPLQLQQARNTVQAQQQAQQDQQATTTAMLGWDGKDPEALYRSVLDNHGSADAAQGVAKHFLDIRTTTATAVKSEGEAAEAKARTRKLQFDQMAGQLNGLTALPDDQLPGAILSTANDWVKQGVMDPQHLQLAQTYAQLPPPAARQAVKTLANSFLGMSEQTEAGLKSAQTAEAQQAAQKAPLENDFIAKYGGLTQPMADAKYRALQQQAATGKQLSQDDAAWTQAYEKQKTIGQQFTIDNRPSDVGTWQIAEDPTTGKQVLFNTKTRETAAVPGGGLAKPGTYQKNFGAATDALNYATNYLADPTKFSGAGDEALLEKYFELAAPSKGFRMTQNQMDMLTKGRSLIEAAKAKYGESYTGTYFSNDQRIQIAQTMQTLAKSKGVGGAGGAAAGATHRYNPATGKIEAQ